MRGIRYQYVLPSCQLAHQTARWSGQTMRRCGPGRQRSLPSRWLRPPWGPPHGPAAPQGRLPTTKIVIWHDTYYILCNISLRFLVNQLNQLFLCELSTFRDKWNNDNFILHKSSRQDKNNSTDPTLGRWNFSLNSLSSRLKIIINRYLNTWHCFFIMDFYYTAKNPIYPWTNFDWANKKRPIILLVKKLAICQI